MSHNPWVEGSSPSGPNRETPCNAGSFVVLKVLETYTYKSNTKNTLSEWFTEVRHEPKTFLCFSIHRCLANEKRIKISLVRESPLKL